MAAVAMPKQDSARGSYWTKMTSTPVQARPPPSVLLRSVWTCCFSSWCNSTNPFVLQRTIASDSLAEGPLSSVPPDVAAHACDPLAPGADSALDNCAAVSAVASAELAGLCDDSLAEGVLKVLCTGERRATTRLLLFGTQSGHLVGVDAVP